MFVIVRRSCDLIKCNLTAERAENAEKKRERKKKKNSQRTQRYLPPAWGVRGEKSLNIRDIRSLSFVSFVMNLQPW